MTLSPRQAQAIYDVLMILTNIEEKLTAGQRHRVEHALEVLDGFNDLQKAANSGKNG